ncbi:MAG TPA: hypothetical protein VFQ37_13005 [Mycobacterium sp.]|nr:hypothetical protein [Mycobacterium sp.]
MHLVLNMIWLIPGGLWLALKRMTLADLKQIPVLLVSLGVEIDPVDSPGRLDRVFV